MTSSREYLCPGCYIQHYSSKRFGIEDVELEMGIEFVDDDQAVEAIDRWGRKQWVVGISREGHGTIWAVDENGFLSGFHPESIWRGNGKS